MPVVTGTVQHENGSPALGFVIRAFDRDMRSEQGLGQTVLTETSGRYVIRYAVASYLRAEKKSADLIVRAYDEDDRLRAESEIVFNAGDEARIDLVVGPAPEPPRSRLSELERLQDDVEPLREEVPYRDFDDQDRRFLLEELIRRGPLVIIERRTLSQRLAFLSLADTLAAETDVPLAAFYGWFREDLPQTLPELLEVPAERLRRALVHAIGENIIPDILADLDDILDRIDVLRRTGTGLVPRQLTVQLIAVSGNAVERPMANVEVSVIDLNAAGDPALGLTTTDRDGLAVVGFSAQANATHRLELTVIDRGVIRGTALIEAPIDTTEVLIVRIPLPPEPESQVRVDSVASTDLSNRLRNRGIETLDDLLANPGVTDQTDPDGLARLRGIARWAVLAPELDPQRRQALVDNGILSGTDLARRTRAEVVGRLALGLGGDAEAYARFQATVDRVHLMQHQVSGAWIRSVTAPGDDDDDPEIPDGARDLFEASSTCACEDCTTAVSPAAYLAQLIDWVLIHVKDGDADIAFADLQNDLHQPFGRLPASCRAVEEEVRQVRLVVESLWRFTGMRTDTDLQMPTPFRLAYRELRNRLYLAILTNLGVSFDQVRTAVLNVPDDDPAAERIAAERASVAGRLGISEDLLGSLFFNIEQPPISPSEELLESTFGYKNTRADDPFSLPGRPDLIAWQRSRLESLWEAQDGTANAYTGTDRLPFVDPAVISTDYLRTPLDENAVSILLQTRAGAMSEHRSAMEALDPLANGVAGLLGSELGTTIDVLRGLSATLLSAGSTEEEILQAQESVAALHLTPAGFAHLMEVDRRQQADEPLGETGAEADAALSAVLSILSRAHRHSLFAEWIAEEDELGIVLGPKLFWIAAVPPPAPNPWQATVAERAAWESALSDAGRPPLIDPDQISLGHITVFRFERPQLMGGVPLDELMVMPGLRPVALWEARRAFVDERLAALEAAAAGQPTVEARFSAALAASTVGLDLDALVSLAALENAGTNLAPHLAQISLTLPEYRFLAQIRALVAAGSPVSADDLAEARAILVQAEKRREFAGWRLEEQDPVDESAPITLRPNRFSVPNLHKPPEDPAAKRLYDADAYEAWSTLLLARRDQFDALEEALGAAVSEAEEEVLPLLRNILIMESIAEGGNLEEKAAWLDGRLLADMAMDGCHMTTRVSYAIETLQRLIRGIYTEEHMPLLQHLTLDSIDDYEREWDTIGDYPSWRAVTLVYLFPENSLHLVPMLRESEAMQNLRSSLPRDAGPAQACEAAHEFSDYFRDVSQLKTEAACQALVRLPDSCEGSRSNFRVLVFAFARARETGNVYVSAFLTYPTDLFFQWSRVASAGSVVKIVGATAHTTPAGRRYIVLFVITEGAGARALEFLRFDLDDLTWSKRRALSLPNGITSGFRVQAIQKRPNAYASGLDDFSPASDFPTLVVVEDSADILYVRRLDSDAQDWAGGGWQPLFGRRASSGSETYDPFKLVGVVQNNADEYLVLIERLSSGDVLFRTLFRNPPGRDDLRWRLIYGFHFYRGALGLPLAERVAVFRNQGAFMHYRPLGPAGSLSGRKHYSPWDGFDSELNDQAGTTNIVSRLKTRDKKLIEFIKDFDEGWLRNRAGISLDDIDITGLAVPLFIPAEIGHIEFSDGDVIEVENLNPLDPADHSVATIKATYTVKGSLLDMVTAKRDDFSAVISNPSQSNLEARYPDRSYYMIQVLDAVSRELAARMKSVQTADYLDSLGPWRLANDQIRNLSTRSQDGIVALVGRLIRNRIETHLLYMDSWMRGVLEDVADLGIPYRTSYKDVTLKQRDGSEVGESRSMLGNWTLPPLSGDGNFSRGASAEQALVLAQELAAYITKFTREGPTFVYNSSYPPARITPDNDGPYDIAPARSKDDLALRRSEIRSLYQRNGAALTKATLSARTLLREAFNLVPIFLGYSLQRGGYYEQALDYYRLVFDDRQIGEARIDYGLELERSLPLDYDRGDEFLSDSANAHAIAATRKNTYTRQIVLMIVRCLIDHADALFTQDTASGNARARELYTRALRLLDLGVLKPGESECANIIGTLEVEPIAANQLPVQQFALALRQVSSPGRVRDVAARLAAINAEPLGATERITAMRTLVAGTLQDEPPPQTQEEVHSRARVNRAAIEDLSLAQRPGRTTARTVNQRRRQLYLSRLAEATDVDETTLAVTPLPWLRERRPPPPEPPVLIPIADTPSPIERRRSVERMRAEAPLATLNQLELVGFVANPGLSFDFCIPNNPWIQALRGRAETNLFKLRTCRNIAGFVRPLDPYGVPIGIGAGVVSTDGRIFNGVVDAPPTIYRFLALIARAKELVTHAQQIEAGYQTALERAEDEELSVMLAEQNVEVAQARVKLQDLRITQAVGEANLTRRQRESAALRERTYAGWIAAGPNAHERSLLDAYRDAGRWQRIANGARTAGQVLAIARQAAGQVAEASGPIGKLVALATQAGLSSPQIAAAVTEGVYSGRAIDAETRAQVASFEANFERQNNEWHLQRGLAALDVAVADQQALIADIQVDVVRQERAIAGLEHTHALDVLRYLVGKTFTAAMYRWIAEVLEDVYRSLLQQATTIGRLAQRQLAFERQEAQINIVQSSYWTPTQLSGSVLTGVGTADRLGLTGSARLLKDIYQLDGYAFETRRKMHNLSITLNLAELYPLEFQLLRQTGEMVFETSLAMIDRQMPGHYLCLIRQVSVAVVGLIDPTFGVRATLVSSGISRAVVGGDTFQNVIIRGLPEQIALTAASTSSGVLDLQPDAAALLAPFEGAGFETLWQLKMPRANNPWDLSTMATILFTVDLTALHSIDYERQVLDRRPRTESVTRALDFRQVFPDAFYDLNNPDLTPTPMSVRFATRREDFPPNLSRLRIQQVVFYFVRRQGETFEQEVRHLLFRESGGEGWLGGPATSVDGRISTRAGNGTGWLPMLGLSPMGDWELTFGDNPPGDTLARDRFAQEQIQNMLLVLTVSGDLM